MVNSLSFCYLWQAAQQESVVLGRVALSPDGVGIEGKEVQICVEEESRYHLHKRVPASTTVSTECLLFTRCSSFSILSTYSCRDGIDSHLHSSHLAFPTCSRNRSHIPRFRSAIFLCESRQRGWSDLDHRVRIARWPGGSSGNRFGSRMNSLPAATSAFDSEWRKENTTFNVSRVLTSRSLFLFSSSEDCESV